MIENESEQAEELTESAHVAGINGSEETIDLETIAASNEGGEGVDVIDKLTLLQRLKVGSELLREIIEWMIEPVNSEQVGRRCKVVALMLWPDGLDGRKSFEALARSEGVTKQTIQALAKRFKIRFGFKPGFMRGDEACENMRAAYEQRNNGQ